jgi:hypothetical protein
MSSKITKISATNQKISGRGGITLFLRYVEQIKFYNLINHVFSNLPIFNSKGLQLSQFIKQMLAFFIDGTDILRKLSIIVPIFLFRKILRTLFIWRLKIVKPKVIVLFIDTMVMNNDDALKREGVEPTYKPVKGFQPLHVVWGGVIIDLIFRKGSAHSNHGTDYIDIVWEIVNLIRKKYDKDVPIIVNTDSGFFDQKAFDYFENELKIHWVSTGTMYPTIKQDIIEIKQANQELADNEQETLFHSYEKGKQVWSFVEFGSRLKSWNKFRRCVYTELSTEKDGQYLFDFHKSDSVIYTNIGINPELDEKLKGTEAEEYFTSEGLIKLSHSKGKGELVHRSIKEFATKEQLPFKKFGMNKVYYYLLVITHFLFETYKVDVTSEVISSKSYPNTLTAHGRDIILHIINAVYNNLKIRNLWIRCQSPPIILLVC